MVEAALDVNKGSGHRCLHGPALRILLFHTQLEIRGIHHSAAAASRIYRAVGVTIITSNMLQFPSIARISYASNISRNVLVVIYTNIYQLNKYVNIHIYIYYERERENERE